MLCDLSVKTANWFNCFGFGMQHSASLQCVIKSYIASRSLGVWLPKLRTGRHTFQLFQTFLRADRKAYTTCNFSCGIGTEGLLKITGSHVHCKARNIAETVQDVAV